MHDCAVIFLSFLARDIEGFGGGGRTSSSSSSTSIDFDVIGFMLAFDMARRRVSSTQASSLCNSVKEHLDICTSKVLAMDVLLRSNSWLA